MNCPDGCGACCDPVVLPYGPTDLHYLAKLPSSKLGAEEENIMFAVKHLTVMPRREGLRRAPYLTQGGSTAVAFDQDSEPIIAWSYFYSCDRFDVETRQCADYHNRPPMCREYPWYDKPLDDEWSKAKALPTTCVYRADIGLPVEPVPVRLIAKP
jgi:Fe-S-cluster containining protein